MGNHSSRKHRRGEKLRNESESEEDTLCNLEDIKDDNLDSYDKLFAWFVEMAEQENNDMDKTNIVNEIRSACNKAKDKRTNFRQHSTSCDSYTSTETPLNSRSGKSSDIHVDAQGRLTVPSCSRQNTFSDEDDGSQYGSQYGSRLTVPTCSRQNTFSDDDDAIEAIKKPKRNYLFSGMNSKSLDIVDPKDILLKKRKDFHMNGKVQTVISNSVGDLVERQPHIEKDCRRKSASISVMRQPTFEKERNASILNLLDRRFDEADDKVLDDTLLDGNLQDILLSVEVLFNKK